MLDNETGLVWQRSFGDNPTTSHGAISDCFFLSINGRKGWRTPTIEELASLVDESNANPALPSGHPFNNIQMGGEHDVYLSSTPLYPNEFYMYIMSVDFKTGNVTYTQEMGYIICVRGGSGNQ